MVQFNPAFEGLTDTKRPVNRTTVNESMAGNVGAAAKKVVALLPKTGGSLADGAKVAGLILDDVLSKFGHIAHLMMEKFFAANPAADVDAVCVASTAGTAAARTITVATTADMDATVKIWLGDYRVDVDVLDGDTAAEIATAIAAAITADALAPYSATADAAVVTCTYDYKGTMGNDVSIEIEKPEDLASTFTVAQSVSGATDPTLSATHTDNYKMTNCDVVLLPLVRDDDNVEHLETVAEFMSNGEQGRGALHIGAIRDSYSNGITWSAARERKDFAVIFQLSTLPWRTPPHHRAAIEAGYVSAQSNPSVPFLNERRAAVWQGASFTRPVTYDTTIENCLRHGLAIDDIDGNTGDTKLVALISTKTKLASGPATDVWESVHVFFVEKFIRRAILDQLAAVYSTPEAKKFVDGREHDVRGHVYQVLARYASEPYFYLSAAALEQHKSGIVVRKNPSNPKRVQIGIPVPIIMEHRGTDAELFVIRP